MVLEEEDRVEKFIGGLPDKIQRNVIAVEPTRLQDAVRIANNLMDQKCMVKCGNYKRVGHMTIDYRTAVATTTQGALEQNQKVVTCCECGRQGHYKSDCPKLKNHNRRNRSRNKLNKARGRAYALGRGGANLDSNVVMGIYVDPAKIELIKDWASPKNPTKIHQVLGLAEKEETAFQMLKHKLCSTLILALPEGKENFVVYYDASQKGLGALVFALKMWRHYMENITIDFVTKLLKIATSQDTIWVIVDRLTKSAHFLTMKETDSMEILTRQYLKEAISRHRVPVSIISDRDKFSYNKNYHTSIKAASFEALYGRKYRSTICSAEVGDSQLTGPEIGHETTEKIIQIKSRVQSAHDRQNSYADVRRKSLKFQLGDKVMLKVSPWKGVIRFGKRGKLNPRYIRPFKIIAKVGTVAYQLELSKQLKRVRYTLHVSNLKKCLSDETQVILLDEICIDDKLYFIEEPIEVIDREVKHLKKSRCSGGGVVKSGGRSTGKVGGKNRDGTVAVQIVGERRSTVWALLHIWSMWLFKDLH
nr:putative reverse transcriptase domain-containing protein [Tanacetum cinerariifolium]